MAGLTDTNLGSFNLKALKRRMYKKGGHHPSITTHNIMKSGLYAVASFPSAVRCPKLIMECANYYKLDHITIVSSDGKLFSNITPEAIGKAFEIPTFEKMYKIKERADKIYASSFERCAGRINATWMWKSRPPRAKLPKQIILEELKQEYYDLIMILNRVNGSPQVYAFEPWMFFYISIVMEGKEHVNWARMISDNIDE